MDYSKQCQNINARSRNALLRWVSSPPIFPRNIALTPAAQFFFWKLRRLLSASFPGFSPTCPYRGREGRKTRDELKRTLRTRLGYCMALKRGEKSLSHVNMVARFLVPNKAWSWNMAEKMKKIDMHDFPVLDCAQEQNGNPYFLPSFACKWTSLSRKIIEVW